MKRVRLLPGDTRPTLEKTSRPLIRSLSTSNWSGILSSSRCKGTGKWASRRIVSRLMLSPSAGAHLGLVQHFTKPGQHRQVRLLQLLKLAIDVLPVARGPLVVAQRRQRALMMADEVQVVQRHTKVIG